MENHIEENCVFCEIASADTGQVQEYDRPILENTDFFVIPALGQFTEGYVLICSRAHHLNLGIMRSHLSPQFLEIKEQVRALLVEEYHQNPIFFEHGPGSFSARAGSCIDHAHLHAIPVDVAVPPSYVSEHLDGGRIAGLSDVVEFAKARKPYFFFECPDGTMYLYHVPLLPCQYGRQILARRLNIPGKWDWRTFPFYEQAIETGHRLRVRIERERNGLNSRILRTAS